MTNLPQQPKLPPLHDLLAAIVETLDVPRPDAFSDERAYHRLVEDRVCQLRGYLRGMVTHLYEPDIHADSIRKMTADNPVTYTPYVRRPDAGGER